MNLHKARTDTIDTEDRITEYIRTGDMEAYRRKVDETVRNYVTTTCGVSVPLGGTYGVVKTITPDTPVVKQEKPKRGGLFRRK